MCHVPLGKPPSDCVPLQIFDSDGKPVHTLDNPSGSCYDWQPYGVAVDSANNILTCDHANHSVKVLTMDGKKVTAFSHEGFRPGQLHKPVSVCVDSDGRILVGDYRVQVFAFE